MCWSCLEENQQILITTCSGKRYVSDGPGCVCIPLCASSDLRSAVILSHGEYANIFNDESGEKRTVHGPTVEWMSAREEMKFQANAPTLTQEQYLSVTDPDGAIQNIIGPTLYKPGPYDTLSDIKNAYNLAKNEYIRIKDETGRLRVIRGETRFVPEPLEEVVGGVQQAINVDEHHAVLIRNEDTGSLLLYTEHGLFFPGPYQDIVEVQQKIVLEEYQTVVYKDATGKFHYVAGNSEMRNFFLPPFCELIRQSWSTDLRKEHNSYEDIWKFDKRPSYMNYEFNCRTVDNVELIINVSFFWAIIDVKLLIEKTADAPGDTCTHARSRIIQEVSKIQLMEFLEKFNEVIRGSCIGDSFYEERGVHLHSVEVLKFSCASSQTDEILQEIIQETADRLKKKERQKGENEVALSRLTGEIEEEKMKKELIELKKSHLKTESRIEGEAEAHKLTAFMQKCADEGNMSSEQAVQMYLTLRKLDSINTLSSGNSTLYVTPNDVNLSVGQMFPGGPAGGGR
eukprot:TRINITY_DN15499_c0_g1_i1.p1 TRINITY_DN15499_c0_g1~~TRINITY_DN15499_c0_g1_i1.p1  ORF type:complete len:512 (+),score=75.99 TRINITY_DN15499_c0_g1_i1:94-1629(+)